MMAMDGPRGSKQCSVDLPHLIAFQDVNPEPKTSRGEDTLFRPAMVKKYIQCNLWLYQWRCNFCLDCQLVVKKQCLEYILSTRTEYGRQGHVYWRGHCESLMTVWMAKPSTCSQDDIHSLMRVSLPVSESPMVCVIPPTWCLRPDDSCQGFPSVGREIIHTLLKWCHAISTTIGNVSSPLDLSWRR